jgi:preprotein translocase subunit SecD
MKKNLNNKIALIVAVLVICVYGIFGVPFGVSGKALLEAMTKRIHLGLDLRGGAHLILQVVVLEAVKRRNRQHRGAHPAGSEDGQPELSQVYKPDPAKPR